jgi:hypothetical protein
LRTAVLAAAGGRGDAATVTNPTDTVKAIVRLNVGFRLVGTRAVLAIHW